MIVGSPGWKYEPILDAMRNLIERGELVHLEKVPSEEMRVLYTHAEAFVFPSNYEGFGFPPLEAMQCGAPVIASDIATHRWVLGDAALVLQPLRHGVDRRGHRAAGGVRRGVRAARAMRVARILARATLSR